MTPQTVLSILILLIIAIIGLLVYQSLSVQEGFTTTKTVTTNKEELSFCPFKTKLYYKGNDIACCDGAVNGNTCEGKPICGRSPNGLLGLPSCRAALETYYSLKSKEVCPSTTPNYYEDEKGSNAGCTKGALTSNMTGPVSADELGCRVYANDADNKKYPNSCLNQKQLDTVECRGINCVKQIVVLDTSQAPLIELQFSDQDGDRHVCYTNESYRAYKPQSKLFTTADAADSTLCDEQFKKYLDRDESKSVTA
jgi:hypothetical protein